MKPTANLLVLSLLFTIPAINVAFAEDMDFPAKVGAIEGTVWVTPGGEQAEKDLQQADVVKSWDTVTTDSQSKVVLQWPDGLTSAMGGSSSMLISPVEMEEGQVLGAQVIGGVFRFARQRAGSTSKSRYVVSTPVAAIYPAPSGQPSDFTVEVYDPKTTIITVLAGEVKVLTGRQTDHLLSSCQSVIIEEGKDSFAPVMVSGVDAQKMMQATTIPGTIAAEPGRCAAVAQEPPPPIGTGESRDYGPPPYAVEDEYYYEDWDTWDFYPYGSICRPPVYPGGPYLCVIPGIGEISIDLPVYIEPAVVNVYVQSLFCRRGHAFYWDYLINCRYWRHYFIDQIAFARLTGNVALLARAQAQLRNLNLRMNWANRRIHNLDSKLKDFTAREMSFAGKLPSGMDLKSIAANSLLTSKNHHVVEKFQDRLKTDANVQARLASVASNQIMDLRKKISTEPNPGRRLALNQQLADLQSQLNRGKMIIPAKDKQLSSLGKELQGKENPLDKAKVQTSLLNQLNKMGPAPRIQGPLSEREVASLHKDLASVTNPQGRQLMEQRLAALEQSVKKNNAVAVQAEQTQKQMDALQQQAGRETNPQKRDQLLRQVNELSRGLANATQERRQLLNQFGPTMPAVGAKSPQQTVQPKVQIEPGQKPKDQGQQQQLKLQEQLPQQQLKRQQDLEKQKSDSQAQQQLKLQEQLQQQQMKRQQELKLQDELRQKQLKQQQLQQQQQQLQQQQMKRQQELKLQDELRQKQLKQQQLQQQQLQLQQQQLRRQQELKLQEDLRQRQLRQQQLQKPQQQQQLKQPQSLQQRMMQPQRIPQQLNSQQFRQPQIPARSVNPQGAGPSNLVPGQGKRPGS